MSGQFPQWNANTYGAQNPLPGHQPGENPGPSMPSMRPPADHINGPGNPDPRLQMQNNSAPPRHPQSNFARPPFGNAPTTRLPGPPGHTMNSSSSPQPGAQNFGHQSIVNGYKGNAHQPGTVNNLMASNSQSLVNGPPRPPNAPIVGPKGQVLGKALSSPPGTGAIETTTLSQYDGQPQNIVGGAPPQGFMGSTVPFVPSVGVRHPHTHSPMPGPPPLPSGIPGGVPVIRGPPPMNTSGMQAHPPGPPPSAIGVRPGPPTGTTVSSGPPMSGPPPTFQSTGSDRPNGLPVPYHGQAQYSSNVHLGPDPNTSGLRTPGSEPASQKSSRAPSPVPSQKYDALEGQFTPGSPPVQLPQGQNPLVNTQPPPPNLGPGGTVPFTAPPPAGAPSPPGITSGKRVYPQMAPSMPPAGGTSQGGMPPPQPGMPPTSQGVPPQLPPVPGMPTQYPPVPGMPPQYPPGPGVLTQPPRQGIPPQHTMATPPPPPMGTGAPSSSGGAPLGSRPNYPNANAPTLVSNVPPQTSTANMINNFGQMNLQPDATRPLNLLQEKKLIPDGGIETCKPNLPSDFNKVNANPDVFRSTLNAIPNTQSLLNKCRLPLGLLIHPFKDLSQLPVIQSSVIVRCRSCRTYINPFVTFMDMRRWKCNLCYRVNELPEEFSYDPVSKSYGDPQRRPEIKSSTIEFIAPSEYMLRPPQPAVYLYLLDVSFNAVNTGYLQVFCQTLLEELDRIPGDSRTQIGFITFDSCLHFYNLQEGLSQPQMLVVSDVEDVFLPLPEGLLVNIHESRELVNDLLNSLPSMFEGNLETGNALGPALQTAHKLLSPTGGRVSVFQTQLPTVGPGALKNREDPNERTGKKVQHLGPAIDFYKKLSLDCSAQQIAVDLFLLNGQYVDMATIAGVSKYSGGCLYYFPNLHTKSNPGLTERFEGTLRRYVTRKVGFESVMRIRCSRGLTIHTFHGNFFVRSTDLLSLPNINPDSGFGMQMSIEDTIESNFGCFQAALLYTSSKGERRIRVHTLCVPITNSITEIFGSADQQAIVGLLSKMAVDKSTSQSMGDARDALVNSCIDMLSAFGATLTSSQRMGQLPCPHTLRLMPALVLALLKYSGFRTGIPTKIDDRVFGLESAKSLPLSQFLLQVYPSLYPVHMLDDQQAINKGDAVIPQPPVLQLSSGNMDRHGAYIMDTNSSMYLWIGAAVSDKFCQEVFDVPNFQAVPDGLTELQELDNMTSERLRTFINYLNDQRPFPAAFQVIREDSHSRSKFLQHMIEDRSDSAFSYYEFLQHLQKEVK